jgi:MoxR-like ATPase
MLKTIIDYPSQKEELEIMRRNMKGLNNNISAVATTKQILDAREAVKKVYIDEKIEQYILDIVFATRYPEKFGLEELKGLINFGASPRASINLATASKAYAFINKRGFVIPEDVRAMVFDVLRHRIGLTYEAEAENVNTEEIITKIVNTIEVP